MEFWGVEVKAGETLTVKPGDGRLLHLSQAALGESKKDKGTDYIPVFVTFDNQKHVLGSLSLLSCPKVNFDLVFEKEFELSHNWKNGSVHFLGYKNIGGDGADDFSDFSDYSMDEDLPLAAAGNGKPELQVPKAKETAGKAKNLIAEKIKDEEASSDDDELDFDSDDLLSEDDSDGADDDSEDEDSEDDEETPTPKKVVGNKKRQAESATKTPVSAKKAKSASPQKTDGKKSGHTATPHPTKKSASKSPNAGNSKTPKSGGKFGSKAPNAHAKAKHNAGK